MNHRLVAALFVALLSVPFPAAGKSVHVPGEFSRARLITSSGRPLNVTAISIRADSLVCTVRQGSHENRQTMSMADVRYLEVARGSSAAKYGWLGALVSSVLSLGAIAKQNVSESPGYGLDPVRIGAGQAVGITAGFAVAGGVIGALIGANNRPYVPIRKGGAWLQGVEVSYCSPSSMGEAPAVAVRLSF